MNAPERPANEAQRLRSLHDLDLLSGWPGPALDDLASLAARCFRAPIATVTLVDSEQECFVAAHGLPTGSGPRQSSFCGYVVLDGGLLVVPDTLADERFKDNPQVHELGIRAYLGAAVRAPDGAKIGALCVKDTRPRFFTDEDIACMQRLAEIVSREFAMRDLARRHQEANRLLRESEVRFRRLADEAPMLVWSSGTDARCDYFNRGWLEFTGRRLEEELGDGWASGVHPDDREACVADYRAAFEARRPYEGRYRLRRRDGAYRWIHDRGAPRYDESGAFLGYIGTCSDVDDLIRTQEDLVHARDAAEAASRAKSEFLALLGHEIRTPLTAILGFTDLLQDDGDLSRAPAQRLEYLDTIRRNGSNLLEILGDMMDVAALERGELSPRVSAFDAAEVLRSVVARLRPQAEAKGLGLVVDLPDRACIRSDPEFLRRIAFHVIGNAVKFTDRGEVRVRARAASAETRGRLLLEVADTGEGIEAARLKDIFTAFGKGDTSMSRRAGGTGMGLALSQRLAAALHGEIAVTSAPGEGSAFTISVPSQGESAAPAGGRATPGLLRGARILLAEDGVDNQRLVSAILRREGAVVQVAENGRHAVNVYRTAAESGAPFDLVLMDMQMPVMDGYTAAGELKRSGAASPIVALTAHARAEDRERCLAAGCDEFLTKPVDRAALVATCGRLVRRVPQPR